MRRRQRGQTLVLFTIFLVVLLGVAGLAIDVSMSYAQARMQHAVADASALAGAQDLQEPGTRSVSATDRTRARTHALQVLTDQLGGTASCDTSVDISSCPIAGTPYVVSIKTPAPSCMVGGCTVSAYHALQVTIDDPEFPLGFSRVFGIDSYNISRTSVAGMGFPARYAIVTLRPPNPLPNGMDQNRADINLAGTNTRVNVLIGDVGTNTSVTTNSASFLSVDSNSGYLIYHYDNIVPDPWNKDASGNPLGQWIQTLIQDPQYMYASFTGAPTYLNENAPGARTSCLGNPDFPTDYASMFPAATTVCQKPGVYTHFNYTSNSDVVYLLPGAYYFPNGMSMHGTMGGGLISNSQGVVLQFPEGVTMDANNSMNILLNMGGSACSSDSCRANPAIDWQNNQVKTPSGMILTIEVVPAPGQTCIDGSGIPHLCSPADNHYKTVGIGGNGQLGVAGVIYGPTDQMTINANNSLQNGVVGQIISWTVTYTGGATLNESYPGGVGNGILRLDPACTAPGTPCAP